MSTTYTDFQKVIFLLYSGHGETSTDNMIGKGGGGDHLPNVGL